MSDIVERLRLTEDMPDADDADFRWYADITDEAADEIETLREQLAKAEQKYSGDLKEIREAVAQAGERRDTLIVKQTRRSLACKFELYEIKQQLVAAQARYDELLAALSELIASLKECNDSWGFVVRQCEPEDYEKAVRVLGGLK